MRVFNLFDGELDKRREQAGFSWTSAAIGPAIGAKEIGASLYELEPGEKSFPYHYEYGAEEWLIVVAGTPALREPGGERELRPGDTVAFLEGPDGAHQVLNRTDEPVRVLILSTKTPFPAVAVYPDSDKLGVWLADGYQGIFRRGDAVDYWEGEG